MTTATGKREKNLCKNAYRWTQTKKVLYQRSAAVGKSEKIHSGYEWGKKVVDKKQRVPHPGKERGEDLCL